MRNNRGDEINWGYNTYIHGNITRKLSVSQAKMLCFSFYVFSPTKLGKRRAEQVLLRAEGWHQWEGGGDGEKG
jgi:hypothetical protein